MHYLVMMARSAGHYCIVVDNINGRRRRDEREQCNREPSHNTDPHLVFRWVGQLLQMLHEMEVVPPSKSAIERSVESQEDLNCRSSRLDIDSYW